MKINILHSECWNGGAERLIFTLAAALVQRGHEVSITTGWFDDYWENQPIAKKLRKQICIIQYTVGVGAGGEGSESNLLRTT